MRATATLALSLLFVSGCQTTALRNRTLDQAATTSDYYYLQVLNNIAQQSVNPCAIPYFSDPKLQQTTVQRQLQATYTPGWDFITSGVYIGRYLFDKQTAAIQGTENDAEGWQGATTDNADKLTLMRAAYHRAIGLTSEKDENLLKAYYLKFPKYKDAVMSASGWFRSSTRKRDIPRGACYVGRCGHCYVWVPDENFELFSEFTLAILDMATVSLTTPTQPPVPTTSTQDESQKSGFVPLANPREQLFFPYTLQSPPPTQ